MVYSVLRIFIFLGNLAIIVMSYIDNSFKTWLFYGCWMAIILHDTIHMRGKIRAYKEEINCINGFIRQFAIEYKMIASIITYICSTLSHKNSW